MDPCVRRDDACLAQAANQSRSLVTRNPQREILAVIVGTWRLPQENLTAEKNRPPYPQIELLRHGA
jgi:hypothetical protein